MIEVNDFSKVYGPTVAIDSLSFSVKSGRILGLIGPNGAGKTTTLRTLAGLQPPTSGELRIAGLDVVNAPLEAKRKLAFIPDEPPLLDDLTVGQHIDFYGRLYGVTDYRERGKTLVEKFGMPSRLGSRTSELSRGMRQKVALICAELYEPQVLLLDEPLTGLDPPGIRTLLDLLNQRAAAGATIVISSHLLAMIEDCCSDVLVLVDGRNRFDGTMAQFRENGLQQTGAGRLEDAFLAATSSPVGKAAGAACATRTPGV